MIKRKVKQIFRGTITKIFCRPPVKNAKCIVEVFESDDGSCIGKKIYLVAGFDLPVAFRSGVRVRFYGACEKLSGRLCVIVKNKNDIKVDISRGSVEAMKKYGILVNGHNGAKIAATEYEDVNIATDIAGIAEIISEIGYDYDKAVEIYDTLKHRAKRQEYISVAEMIQNNPLIIQQVNGISYKEAYDLAKKLGKSAQNYELELYAAATAIVRKFTQNGESFMPLRSLAFKLKTVHNRYFSKDEHIRYLHLIDVIEKMPRTLKGSTFGRLYFRNFGKNSELKTYRRTCYIEAGKDNPDKDALADMMGVYPAKVYISEKKSAELLAKHISRRPESDSFVSAIVSKVKNWNELDSKQQEAIQTAAKHPFCIWIGAAGTGKTHAIRVLANAALAAECEVVLLSPTAIAADRLTRGVEGVKGMTVHRYARIQEKDSDYLDVEFQNKDNGTSVPVKKRFVIIDEAVMLDICAFYHLMCNVSASDHLIICGDLYQLPAVGPSGFVHQLCKIGISQIPVVELEVPHRHDEKNREKREIYEFASSIRKGEFAVPKDTSAVEFRSGTKKEITVLVKQLYDEGVGKENLMVLVPTKSKGEICADRLNFLMQREFNPDGDPVSGTIFKVGDPVINVRNDYYRGNEPEREEVEDTLEPPQEKQQEKRKVKRYEAPERHRERKENVYNGYRGVIVEANESEMIVEYQTTTGPKREPYTVGEAAIWLDLAYTLTVHKAQGGEADYVIVAGAEDMDRQMLYTAVTRAKKKLYLMFSEEEAKEAVSRVRPEPRSGFIVKLLDSLKPSDSPGEIIVV
ncbi:MAG: exodeoxyribonuclease alpha subunit [Thermacetogenium sp.]|nr:exodeoxyribonuclease alpha subunit [Thermacetogenium sp.]